MKKIGKAKNKKTMALSVIFSYSPGDVAMVVPKNMADTVDDFMTYFHLEPDQLLRLHQTDPGRF